MISIQAQINLNTRRFDYDGDGKTDVSVFRTSTGEWYLKPFDGGDHRVAWGVGTDKIVPADYDADGKTMLLFFDPQKVAGTSLTARRYFLDESLGNLDDIPHREITMLTVVRIVAIFRHVGWNWWLNRTTLGLLTVSFGLNGDFGRRRL